MATSTAKPPMHPLTPTATASLSTDSNPPLKSDFNGVEYGATAPASSAPSSFGLSPSPSFTRAAVAASASRPSHTTIAASTSFFGIPLSFSTHALRASISTQFNLNATPNDDQIDFLSLYVIYFVTLVAEAARGLLLPSTWPYYHSLGGAKASLGVFVASFSLGRMFSSTPLGYMSDKYSLRLVLSGASLVQVLGHLGYALAPTLPILVASRVVVGFGSSTMAVCRAHLTRSIPGNRRTHFFAYLSGLQFIGFAVLPGLGGAMATIPTFSIGWANFNAYTYPAYFLAFANLVCIAAIQGIYLNPPPARPRIPNIRSASLTRLAAIDLQHQATPDALAMVVCLLINIVFRGVIAEFETITVPFLMEQYHVSFDVGSYFLSFVGFIGLFVYLSFKWISSKFSDRSLVLVGLGVILIGCVPLSLPYISVRLPFLIYVICLGVTWSVAYPIGQTAVLALFSKILYGLPAGGLLGVFSTSGSIARLSLAILASEVWTRAGKSAVFAVICAYVLVAIALTLVSYGRLKPRTSFWS